MEFETVVLESSGTEEMDLGDAREAYYGYPEARAIFRSNLAEYQGLLDSLAAMSPGTVTNAVKNRVDMVAEEAERAERGCAEMKGILSRKLEALLAESQELASELAYHGSQSGEVDALEQIRSLIDTVAQMGNRGEILDAVECACNARSSLADRLAKADQRWFQEHRDRFERLRSSWA